MKRWILAIAVVALGLAGFTAPTLAQTPDGETPANEGVCDILQGATPGLYGLCVAYCEAQDLDTFDKEPPSTKILANYNKKKKAGDPDMPCLKVPCPCWSDEELASITSDGIGTCVDSTDGLRKQVIDNMSLTKFAEADTGVGRERCRYIDLNVVPRIVRSFSITAEEAQSCFGDVEQACLDVTP